MKLTATGEAKLPAFMKEDWLEETLKELDRSNLTPEQRAALEMTIAGNMIEKVAMEEEEWKEREKKKEKKVVAKSIQLGILTDEQIADINDVSVDFIKRVRAELNEESRSDR